MKEQIPDYYGELVFNDSAMRARLPKEVYKALKKTITTGKPIDNTIADTVACAMKDWAIEKGATHYTHWFQPLTAVTAEKHDAFIELLPGDLVVMELSGKSLVQGEPDASSFPSGGLRATCAARGYTTWDPSSYAFVKDGTLYIPTAFCSYTGESLDFKTPLLRSMEVLGEEALRIVRIFGDNDTKRVSTTVGAEQEYFLVNKEYYDRRPDLLYTGRTLFGAPAPKGQDLEDHYFGHLKPKVAAFMRELDETLWRLGVSSKTKHNETAPAQHEMAPIYTTTNMAVDQNLLVMEVIKETALKHSFVALLHEKPYRYVNGSGKHNNWSLTTDKGKNLLSPGKSPIENTQFLLILAAIVKAVDEYQELLRMSVASAGNDHRLGSGEAPPAIISMFVGEELTDVISSIVSGNAYEQKSGGRFDLGIHTVPTFEKDTTDRNRTSPFAFTGNKFEFRMLGASQNIALPNVVLNTAVAKEFKTFADIIEASEDKTEAIASLIKETFTRHGRILYNGDGYSEAWAEEAKRRGLKNLASSVEAFEVFDAPKNAALFTEFSVFSPTELFARKAILFETYQKTIHIEAKTAIDMFDKDILPAVEVYLGRLMENLHLYRKTGLSHPETAEHRAEQLSSALAAAFEKREKLASSIERARCVQDPIDAGYAYSAQIVPLLDALRAEVDTLEQLTARELWPYPTYGELMFRQ